MFEETQRGWSTTGLRRCLPRRKMKHLESCCNISVGREEYSIIQFFYFFSSCVKSFRFLVNCTYTVSQNWPCCRFFVKNFLSVIFKESYFFSLSEDIFYRFNSSFLEFPTTCLISTFGQSLWVSLRPSLQLLLRNVDVMKCLIATSRQRF